MVIVLGFSAAALAMYSYIDRETTRKNNEGRSLRQEARRQREAEGLELERIKSGETASSSEDESAPKPPPVQAVPLVKEPKSSLREIFR